MLEIGLNEYKEMIVTHNESAAKMKSGNLKVFATPCMIALMENTCAESVQKHLETGYDTVGIEVNIKHIAATKIGKKVWCNSKLISINKNILEFTIEVFDEKQMIGNGTHKRAIINVEKFLSRVNN